MKKHLLMRAIGEISDSHVVEFAEVKPQKRRAIIWVKIISAAACLGLFIMMISIIENYVKTPSSPVSTIPRVKINDMVYTYDPIPYSNITQLSKEYVVIGKVERNITASVQFQDMKNGDSAGCKVGEEIFQSPDLPNEIYVYSKLFGNGEDYWYVRFVYKE